MKQEKQTEVIKIQAEKDFILPVYYEGKIVRVNHLFPSEFEVSKLPYESKIHIEQAIKFKSVKQIKEEPKK